MGSNQHPLYNWIPYKIITNNQEVLCQWLYASDKKYNEPFFDETILKCKKHPFNSSAYKSVSVLTALPEFAESIDSVLPDAFIFHISRCGSTILSQLLGLDSAISLAEVPIFDEILRLPFKHPETGQKAIELALKSAIKLMGQKRSGQEDRFFIKVDSWHLFFFDIYRKLYPNTPFVILIRNPEEVIDSHRKLRGMQAVPGVIEPEILGIELTETLCSNLDEYTALVLEKYFEQIEHSICKDKHTFLLPYTSDAMEMIVGFSDLTGIRFTESQLAEMKTRSAYNAKFPQSAFTETQNKETFPEYLKPAVSKFIRLLRHCSLQA